VALTVAGEYWTVLIEPEVAGASIALIGNFNPAIMSPDWFVRHGLINEGAIVRNDPEAIVHPQLAQFKLDWCQVVVEPNRFSISGTKDPLGELADLTAKTFGELLAHTPVRQLGINRQVHFRVASVDVRDAVGFRLAPPDAWGDWGPFIKARSDAKRGGMRSLTMEQRVFDHERTGFIAATVQPSNLLPRGLGIFVQVNDHHDMSEADVAAGARAAVTLIQSNFDRSRANADKIIDHIMRLAHEAAAQNN
jgi:hypothetical protein